MFQQKQGVDFSSGGDINHWLWSYRWNGCFLRSDSNCLDSEQVLWLMLQGSWCSMWFLVQNPSHLEFFMPFPDTKGELETQGKGKDCKTYAAHVSDSPWIFRWSLQFFLCCCCFVVVVVVVVVFFCVQAHEEAGDGGGAAWGRASRRMEDHLTVSEVAGNLTRKKVSHQPAISNHSHNWPSFLGAPIHGIYLPFMFWYRQTACMEPALLYLSTRLDIFKLALWFYYMLWLNRRPWCQSWLMDKCLSCRYSIYSYMFHQRVFKPLAVAVQLLCTWMKTPPPSGKWRFSSRFPILKNGFMSSPGGRRGIHPIRHPQASRWGLDRPRPLGIEIHHSSLGGPCATVAG